MPQSDGGYTLDTSQRETVRMFYKTVFASSNNVAMQWTGDIVDCNAGDTSAEHKLAVLRRINWFRAMAGVPADVQLEPAFNRKAQQAALMVAANTVINAADNHHPTAAWACYSVDGAEAAGKSNLARGSTGANSITDGYMRDPDSNNFAVGHRRILLHPQTRLMGVGDVDGGFRANALWTDDGNYNGVRPAVRDDFFAWPPKGYVPYTAVYPRWSISYRQADFSRAVVTMAVNGQAIAVQIEPVATNMGENTLVWIPGNYVDGMSWTRPVADTEYDVQVSNVMVGGVARSFAYKVTVFDPDSASTAPNVVSNGPVLYGSTSQFTATPIAGALQYQWRSLSVLPFAFNDGAEQGLANFTVSTSPGYSPVATDVASSGARSFRLAQPLVVDQILQLKASLMATAESRLSFASRLGISGTGQTAYVEISRDDGGNWSPLFQQSGQNNSGEGSFSIRNISLADYAGQVFLLRFRYASAGAASTQTQGGAGWYIDDIRLDGVQLVTMTTAPFTTLGAATGFATTQAGDMLVQARAGMYGQFAGWGAVARALVSETSATSANCLLDWAQRNYSKLFPSAAPSQVDSPYLYRHYARTNAYLGISAADSNVYYLANGQLQNFGPASAWFATAGCI